MSIDEVMTLAHEYRVAWIPATTARDQLRAAVEQHVADAVAREREELLDLVDSYAKDNTDLKDAIRARAEKEEATDDYGNPLDGDQIINCCFPDCGCDSARLCMAESGPSSSAMEINIERRSR